MNMMDHEPIWNHPLPDPQANLGGTSCAMFSSKDFGAYGPNTLAYTNVASTTNYPSMPILNLEVPSYVRANVGMSQEPYVHCLSSRNTSPFPHYYVQRELCFSHLNVGDLSGIANFSVDATYKRNMPIIQNFSDSGSTNACYNAASSFSHPVSTGILDSRQTLDLHYSCWNPNRMVSGCRSNNLLSPGLDQRKVRGQRTCVLHPGNASSDHFHSGPTTSVLNAPGQWNHCAPISLNSHARLIHTSDISSFNHELNQLHGAPHIDGGHNFCLIPGPPTPDLAVYHNTYEQRTNYRPNLSYQPLGFEANMVEFRQPAEETDVLRRHSRGLSTVGHVSERNGRGRIIHHASSPQTLAVMDGSMFYGSTNLFDENHDMRLDIENEL